MTPVITLYSFADFDRSSRVRWLLHELKLEYREVRIEFGCQYSNKYKAINPVSKVPCLQFNGHTIFESGAIFTYLLQKYKNQRLIPVDDNE